MVRAFACWLGIMATAAWVSAGEPEKRKFDVPADLAEKSLRVFSVQSGFEVLFSSDAASGVRTNAIKGEFLPGEAVKKMLAGTTLYVRDERDGVFRIAATPRPKAPGAALNPGPNDRPGEAKSGARSRDPPPGTSSTAQPNQLQTSQPQHNESPPVKNSNLLSFLAGWLAASPATDAQTASAPAKNETVTLSPFEVNTDRDTGFAAATSLAGGRLALDLKDTPVAYSVLTSEFIAALRIVNLEEAAQWSPNSAGIVNGAGHGATDDVNGTPGNYTVRGAKLTSNTRPQRNFFPYAATNDSYAVERYDFGRGPNSILFGNSSLGGMSSTTTKQARLDRRFTTLGLTLGSWSRRRGTFDVNIPVNERLALRVAAVDAHREGWRDREFEETKAIFLTSTFKVSKNTSLRMEGEVGSWKRSLPSPNIRDFFSGWDGVSTFTGQVTSLPTDGNARGINRLGVGPVYYPFSPVNAVMNYQWQAITVSGAANNQVPIAGVVQGSLPAFNASNGSLLYSLNLPANRFEKAVANSAFRLPSDSFSMSSDTPMIAQKFNDFQITLDHRIGNLYLQFAADRNRVNQQGHMLEVRGGADILIDINKLLPDGTPNPKFLQPYSDATLRENFVWRHGEGVRLAAGVPVNAHRWGRYNFSVQSGLTDTYDAQSVYVLSTAQNADRRVWGTAASDLIRRRSYLGDTARPYPIAALKTIRFIDPISGVDKTINPIWALENNRPDSITQTNIRYQYVIASLNARFWGERVVVLAGVRGDRYSSYSTQSILQGDYPGDWAGTYPIYKPQTSAGWAALTYIPKDATGKAIGPAITADARPRAPNGDRLPQYARDAFKDDTNAPQIIRSKVTKTAGFVFRPTAWFNPFINYAETFNPNQALQLIDTSFALPTVLSGVDMGVRFALLKGRINLSITHYNNKEKNSLVGNTIGGNVNSILSANAVGDESAGGINKRGVALLPGFTDLRDRTAQGMEGELTANITKGWRMMASFGIPKAYESNTQRDSRKYLDENLPGILKKIVNDAGVLIDAANRATVDTSIPINDRSRDVNGAVTAWNTLIDTQNNFVIGRRIIQDQPNANLFTDYTLQTGWLKRLRVGGGLQWRAAPIIGYRGADTIVDPTNPTRAIDNPDVDALTQVYGLRDSVNVVASFGYTLRLAEKRELVVDLRVNNVLNRRGPMYGSTVQRPKDNDYTSAARVATPTGFSLPQPIDWQLTATLKF